MLTLELAGNTAGMNVTSPYGRYFTKKTIIAKPLDSKFSNHEKQELLTWRNTLLRKVNNYIDNDRNPAKVNVVDPTKHNFSQP